MAGPGVVGPGELITGIEQRIVGELADGASPGVADLAAAAIVWATMHGLITRRLSARPVRAPGPGATEMHGRSRQVPRSDLTMSDRARLDGHVSELEVMDHCRLLLRGVWVLHERGLELARVSPGMAPSGMYWRLSIAPATSFDPTDPQGWRIRGELVVSWTSGNSPEYAGVIMTTRTTPDDVADHVVTLLPERTLRGEDVTYTRWYAGLLAECERLKQVPVAFSDSGQHGWQIGWGGPAFASPPPPPVALHVDNASYPGRANPYAAHVSEIATPKSLAAELGMPQRAIRQWLRDQGWQSVPYARWQLSPEQAQRVRQRFGGSGQGSRSGAQ